MGIPNENIKFWPTHSSGKPAHISTVINDALTVLSLYIIPDLCIRSTASLTQPMDKKHCHSPQPLSSACPKDKYIPIEISTYIASSL